MSIRKVTKGLSIRQGVIFVSIAVFTVAVLTIGSVVFANWMASSMKMAEWLALEANKDAIKAIDTFLDEPLHINVVTGRMIEEGLVDFSDQTERDRFTTGVLLTHIAEITSFTVGFETGELYGARRNEDGGIEVLVCNEETGWNSVYYSWSREGTKSDEVLNTGPFDPRARDWYLCAKAAGRQVFSPIYKHLLLDDLTLSAAYPIYSEDGELEGVLGTHLVIGSISRHLQEIMASNEVTSAIVETGTGFVVANSLGLSSYEMGADGQIHRLHVQELGNKVIEDAFTAKAVTRGQARLLESDGKKYYASTTSYEKDGLLWEVVVSVPQSLFISQATGSMNVALVMAAGFLVLYMLLHGFLAQRLTHPLQKLITAADRFSSGDLSFRAEIAKDDELGKLGGSLNRMADTIKSLLADLEGAVMQRTEQLNRTNEDLEASRERLQTLLDSTAEAIYGIDTKGECTFCNRSFLRIMGYERQEQLLGRNMHYQIHHTGKDGARAPVEECEIFRAFIEGRGVHSDSEIFWKADGTPIEVEYRSYPIKKAEQVVGAVVTFTDNSEKRRNEERIRYLSSHDSLTGLLNRASFEGLMKDLDTQEQFPLAVIFGDVNGLKLTNDVFGHASGDVLIRKAGEALERAVGSRGKVCRVGGDEFAAVVPRTSEEDIERIIKDVRADIIKERELCIKLSMALGYYIKESPKQRIESVIESAENMMYKDKTLNRRVVNSEMISTIMSSLHMRSPKERQHSINVSAYCHDIGNKLGMDATIIKKLREAGYIHDIGKVALDAEVLNKDGPFTEDDKIEMQQHPVVGFKILNIFDDTLDLAEAIYSHHERWDGSGYPKGLKGREIPISSRVIAVAEYYDALTNTMVSDAISSEEAKARLCAQAGSKLDPEIVSAFISTIR